MSVKCGEKFLEFLKKAPALIFLGLMMVVKFGQLFYYMVIKKETAISFRYFLKIFDGLWNIKNSVDTTNNKDIKKTET